MKAICRNCHFLAKDCRDETTGGAYSFSLSQKEREAFDSGDFSQIGTHYALKCHHGVWDEGLSPGQEKRPEIILHTNRENQCFFFPFKPEMLFRAAETLQRRAVENQQLKRAHYFTVAGLIIAGLGLIANAAFSFIGALSNQTLRDIWHVDRQTALRRAKRLVETEWLTPEGQGKGRRYKPGPNAQKYATPS